MQAEYSEIFRKNIIYAILSLCDFLINPFFLLLIIPTVGHYHGQESVGLFLLLMSLTALGPVINLGVSNAALQTISKEQILTIDKSLIRLWMTSFVYQTLAVGLALGLFFALNSEIDFLQEQGMPIIFLIIVACLLLEQCDMHISAALKSIGFIRLCYSLDVFLKLVTYTVGAALIVREEFIIIFFSLFCASVGLRFCAKLGAFMSVRRASLGGDNLIPTEPCASSSILRPATGFFILALNGYLLTLGERWVLPGIFGL